jgi:hypothetical protein
MRLWGLSQFHSQIFLTAVLGFVEVVGYQLGPAQFAGQLREAGGVDEKYVRCLLPRHISVLIPLCAEEEYLSAKDSLLHWGGEAVGPGVWRIIQGDVCRQYGQKHLPRFRKQISAMVFALLKTQAKVIQRGTESLFRSRLDSGADLDQQLS